MRIETGEAPKEAEPTTLEEARLTRISEIQRDAPMGPPLRDGSQIFGYRIQFDDGRRLELPPIDDWLVEGLQPRDHVITHPYETIVNGKVVVSPTAKQIGDLVHHLIADDNYLITPESPTDQR